MVGVGERLLTHDRSVAAAPPVDHASALRDAIEREYHSLRRGVAALIWKTGMATHSTIDDVTDEVVQEVVARAMAKPEAYDPSRLARPWLLKFATFVLIGRRDRAIQRPTPLSLDALRRTGDDADAEYTLAERLHAPDAFVETRTGELLAMVSPADREVLRLGFVEGLRGREMAAVLGINEGAARVRFSRAIARLSTAYHAAERGTQPVGSRRQSHRLEGDQEPHGLPSAVRGTRGHSPRSEGPGTGVVPEERDRGPGAEPRPEGVGEPYRSQELFRGSRGRSPRPEGFGEPHGFPNSKGERR
jgi:RNA polymerase sigma factor (sigma-70 family)